MCQRSDCLGRKKTEDHTDMRQERDTQGEAAQMTSV